MVSDSNKRIAKNTVFLYFRMIVTMLVTLYTVRVVLATLGEEDYGIYNIIGGVVVLFSFLNTAMNNATQRFLSYEIGRGDDVQLRKTFSMSINCHLMLSLLILLFAETIGLWFVVEKLNIPEGREYATFWVYQFSIATFIFNIIRVPYNASVISHERMSFFAYLSILEVLLNLAIVYLLLLSSGDKLILYSILKFAISLVCWGVFYLYCRNAFDTCRYQKGWDKDLYSKLMSFTGWSMLGGGSVLITQSGSNIILNLFHGVAVNAAYGIANQVSAAIYGFVSNFQLAFQPQIVKLHAENKKEEQAKLINRSALISYYLLLMICIPFFLNTDYVLGLWLHDVPKFSVTFCQFMLLYSMIDAIQAPIWMAINATGNIKNYCLWTSIMILANLPVSWVLLRSGLSPVSVFVVRVVINLIIAVVRVIYARSFISFPSFEYVALVIKRALPVTLLSVVVSVVIKRLLPEGFLSFIIVSLLSLAITILVVLVFGLSKGERNYLYQIIVTKIRK